MRILSPAIVCSCIALCCVAARGADVSAGAWRSRVRSELAELAQPAAPPQAGNPIDAFLADWWSGHKLKRPARTSDSTFLRRVSLDLVGLLPDAEAVKTFLADPSADKRTKLINRLLDSKDAGASQAYAEHWMTFWNDLLRNDEQNYILVTRQPITPWLFDALTSNKPYDEFAGELISPPDERSAGFVKGLLWEFSSSVSDTPPMQAAQSTAQVFQGVNLKCASCHDHFSRSWKLGDSWAMASFFTNEQLQLYRCDKLTGEQASPRFLFAGLGEVPAQPETKPKLAALAHMVTRPKNPRFAKVIVNRMFKRLIGQGLIDEVDDLDDQTAFQPQLLDWLADDFMRHDYDLKYLLRLITTSETYQLESVRVGADETVETFVGPHRRRLSVEQLQDAIATVTGHWPQADTMKVKVPGNQIRAWRYREPSQFTTVLGRPTRDVVCSGRPQQASVLQALELVNGLGFRNLVIAGAEKLLTEPAMQKLSPREIADYICYRAYCRPATNAEGALADEMFAAAGSDAAVRKAAWEDLLWITFTSPEFAYLD